MALWSSAALADLRVGVAAPTFSLRSLAGRNVTLASLRGKVVFLDFWASWCVPCRAEFPVLQRLSDRYAARGLRVVGVSLDEEVRNARAFVRRAGTRFMVLHDGARATADRYSPRTMPTSFVIDRQGVIRQINRGFAPADGEKFERQIRAALGI